jgi:hypothetical protein
MNSVERVFPLLHHPLNEIELIIHKQLGLDLDKESIKRSHYELLSLVQAIRKMLEQNLQVTNVNFQEIVKALYRKDKTLEAIQLNILIKDCKSYSRIAHQKISLFKLKN